MGRPTLLHPSSRQQQQFLDIHLANAGLSSSITTTTLLQQPQPSNIHPAKRAEANTRVQLQKQRLEEQQHAVDTLTKTIPGLKTSAAFFTSLRTNLNLHSLRSPPPTPPPSHSNPWTTLPPPSPLSLPVTPTDSVMDPLDAPPPPHPDPLAHLPALSTYPTTSTPEKTTALHLIADSIAQQRQTANKTLILHPLHLTLLAAALASTIRTASRSNWDTITILSISTGILMAYLLTIRMATQGYLTAAEGVGWEWLGDDEVIVTKFGDEVIGVVVVRWILGESVKQRRKRAWRGEVRGWTVRRRYRGKGVGGALLEEVVKEMKRKGGEGVEFGVDHANAQRVLPAFYNGVFDKRERRAREALFDLLQSSPRGKRK